MKLSVIIPCYNAEKHIGNCINKILNKQIDNVNLKSDEIEILVINDGSTDNSQKIIADIATNQPIIKLINKTNEGVSIARNTGIKNAIGKWITFIDADDFLDPMSLSKLVKVCESTNSDVITFQYRHVETNYNSIPHDNPPNISGPIDGLSYIVKTEGLNWRHSSCINIYNKNFIINNNIFFPTSIDYSEDCIFVWNVFFNAQKVYCINNIFYNYVINANSCMNNKSQEHLINLTKSTFPLIKEFKSLQNLGNTIINKYIDRNINFLVVWHINNLIQANKSLSTISDDINVFKAMGLYPIADFTKFPGYNSKKIKLYRIIFNNKLTLYSLYYCYKPIKIFKHYYAAN